MAGNVIAKQLDMRKMKRDVDVKELYLGESDLVEVNDLSRFKNLHYLWLNANKLCGVSCLSQNFRLSELYLQNNKLVNIAGMLSHLSSLTILFLNNNQLQNLEKVINELINMQKLHSLKVLIDERNTSERMYKQKETEMRDMIAFGRRSEGPPSLFYPGNQQLQTTKPDNHEVGNNFYRNNPPYATEDQAIKMRALRHSVIEYTSFDWSKVPTSLQRRTAEKPFENPQVITTRFR